MKTSELRKQVPSLDPVESKKICIKGTPVGEEAVSSIFPMQKHTEMRKTSPVTVPMKTDMILAYVTMGGPRTWMSFENTTTYLGCLARSAFHFLDHMGRCIVTTHPKSALKNLQESYCVIQPASPVAVNGRTPRIAAMAGPKPVVF